MNQYCVNKQAQSTGDHEVHVYSCSYLPALEHQLYLGAFSICYGAVEEARKTYRQSNGCYWCCNPCHTG